MKADREVDHGLRQLEQIVEREVRMLEALPDCGLSPERLARVCAVVRAEAARMLAMRRRRAAWCWCGSTAAAILLTAGLRLVQPAPPEASLAVDAPLQRLDEWIATLEESRQLLLDDGSFCLGASGFDDFDDEKLQLDELLKSLENSLNFGA